MDKEESEWIFFWQAASRILLHEEIGCKLILRCVRQVATPLLASV